jgi:Flp pilus assembly protein TadB
MAQTKKRRRKKHRGTQTGRIDNRSRGRPRNRAEARSRARSKSSKTPSRQDRPPSWRTAFYRGLFAAVIFSALMLVGFGRTVAQSIFLAVFMLVVYVPFGYYFDLFFYRRRQRHKQQERDQRREG